jgi:antitoxin YefM
MRAIRLTHHDGLAILLAMALSEHLSLADVKNRLSEVVDKLEREHGRVVVTKHGRPAAVMLNVDDLESLEETLEILSNPRLRDAIREGEADVAAGRTDRLTKDQALARVSTR